MKTKIPLVIWITDFAYANLPNFGVKGQVALGQKLEAPKLPTLAEYLFNNFRVIYNQISVATHQMKVENIKCLYKLAIYNEKMANKEGEVG